MQMAGPRLDGLSRYPYERIVVSCDLCRRRGDYRKVKLQELYGDAPMGDLALLLAQDAGCDRAADRSCRATVEPHEIIVSERLGDVAAMGWVLKLSCQRRRAGLKSIRPCIGIVTLEMTTLVAAYGPFIEIDQLQRRLFCPRCGSHDVMIRWMIPAGADAKRA